jgi:hypothetical protein
MANCSDTSGTGLIRLTICLIEHVKEFEFDPDLVEKKKLMLMLK